MVMGGEDGKRTYAGLPFPRIVNGKTESKCFHSNLFKTRDKKGKVRVKKALGPPSCHRQSCADTERRRQIRLPRSNDRPVG